MWSSRRFTQKQNLQVKVGESVKTPPSKGPAAEAAPYMLVTTDTYRCLFLAGTTCPITVKVPHQRPPPAAPEMSRPMMKGTEVGAEALMIEPISKTTIEMRYTSLMGKRVHSCPKAGWNDMSVKKYELPYQPTRLRLSKSVVIRGTAVALAFGQYLTYLTNAEQEEFSNAPII